MKIGIAGANGFIGEHLIQYLLNESKHDIIALSRQEKKSKNPRLKWRKCDLFSMKDTEKSLQEVDIAIYLVHSMMPNVKLFQGSFMDMDLILADNFSRSCKKNKVKKIIYVGGIIPNEKLSDHLQSRLEVEETLSDYNNLISLRAGIVLGSTGSSFILLKKLIEKLPIMLLPSWTKTKSKPIHINNLLEIILISINHSKKQGIYELGGKDTITYKDMIKKTAKKLGLKRLLIPVPLFSPRLSRLWVSLISTAPKALVYPLIDSLKHNMVPNEKLEFNLGKINYLSFEESLDKIFSSQCHIKPRAFRKIKSDNLMVQSVQRMPRYSGRSIGWYYFHWLDKFMGKLIQVKRDNNEIYFYSIFKRPLLHLTYVPNSSDDFRELYYIQKSLLSKENYKARLEFRTLKDGEYNIIAIHEYEPTLPWFIYRYTQAILHLWVMKSFLKKLEQRLFK